MGSRSAPANQASFELPPSIVSKQPPRRFPNAANKRLFFKDVHGYQQQPNLHPNTATPRAPQQERNLHPDLSPPHGKAATVLAPTEITRLPRIAVWCGD